MFSSVAAVEPSLPRRGILQNTVTSALLSQVLQNVLLLFFNIISLFKLILEIYQSKAQSQVLFKVRFCKMYNSPLPKNEILLSTFSNYDDPSYQMQ